MPRSDSLFARLFGVFLAAIVLAHALAFAWFSRYGGPHQPPPPPPVYAQEDGLGATPPPGTRDFPPHEAGPPPPRLDGPLIILGFQLATLLLAAWYGARLLSRPIRHLAEAAEQLAEDLDNPPLPLTGPLEARQAAQAFNQMQQRIRGQVQQRTRMLAAVSHDLRTPLSRLKLRLEQVPNTQLRERMAEDLRDMTEMLDATLGYLSQQHSIEAPQQLDVQALVEALVEDACERGEDVGVRGKCAPLLARPVALRSCINNLVENALRYAEHAEVELRESAEWVEIRVIDHGPGIAPALHESVFEAFYRVEGSRNRNSGGVGLGLTIAREAARRQGGDIHLEETPGGGLTAVLRLPRTPAYPS